MIINTCTLQVFSAFYYEGIPQGTGGPSLYEPRPSYQDWVQKIVGNVKGSPDVAFFSGGPPGVSGACIFASINNNPGEWRTNGGTSLSAPAIAGVINAANHRAHSTVEALTYIYGNAIKNYSYYWHDITSGFNGYPSLKGYDFVTGLGTPRGYLGK